MTDSICLLNPVIVHENLSLIFKLNTVKKDMYWSKPEHGNGESKHRKHPETLMFCWQNIRENIITKNILINKSEIVIVISFFFDLLVTLSLPSSFRWYDFVFSDQTYSSDVISKWKTQEVLKSKFTDQHRML